jgi:hypothetical protein
MGIGTSFILNEIGSLAAGSAFAPILGPALIAGSALWSVGSFIFDVLDWNKQYDAAANELQKQNMERAKMQELENKRLERMREMNYAREAIYERNTRRMESLELSAIVSSGISMYSGYAQQRRLQLMESRRREAILIRLGQA